MDRPLWEVALAMILALEKKPATYRPGKGLLNWMNKSWNKKLLGKYLTEKKHDGTYHSICLKWGLEECGSLGHGKVFEVQEKRCIKD